jgi:imidazolonepropionase-like amidohydrolase
MKLAAIVLCAAALPAADLAITHATILDGTGAAPLRDATLLVRNGKVAAVGPKVKIPTGAQTIDASGKTVIPGLISAHSHVNRLEDLGVFARYGVTTVMSLGGPREIEFRDATRAEQQSPGLTRARLFIAGPIPTSRTAEEGRAAVAALAGAHTDFVKFRLDDNLGAGTEMPAEAYAAIIDEAHKKGMRVAVHAVYLRDAKAVLRLGAEYIAHSVRDADLDDETIALLKRNRSCYSPTLMREVSTFVYGDRPAFLSDPFFLRDADRAWLAQVNDPDFQAKIRGDKAAQWYKEHLPQAMRNLKKAEDAGVLVAMGTDTGPATRFQGYFEHLELEQMVKSGLTPMQAVVAATRGSAQCLEIDHQVGTLTPGKWADFLVLSANPLDDIANTRKLESVYIAGERLTQNRDR